MEITIEGQNGEGFLTCQACYSPMNMLPCFSGLIFKKLTCKFNVFLERRLFLSRVRPLLVPTIRAHLANHPWSKAARKSL